MTRAEQEIEEVERVVSSIRRTYEAKSWDEFWGWMLKLHATSKNLGNAAAHEQHRSEIAGRGTTREIEDARASSAL